MSHLIQSIEDLIGQLAMFEKSVRSLKTASASRGYHTERRQRLSTRLCFRSQRSLSKDKIIDHPTGDTCREKNLPRDSPARGAWGKECFHRTALAACSSLHDPGISLAEVLAWRFLLRRWMASLLFELISPSQRFIGFGSFLCHVQSFPQTKPDYHARGFQTAPLPELS
jgi:hypothetical protein